MHFDPYRAIKFIVYLTDSNNENGAFCCIPKSHHVGKMYRETKMNIHDKSGLLGGVRHRLEDYTDNPEHVAKDVISCDGSAGDMIIIDTDILHMGGIVKSENNIRKVIIVHNRLT